MNSFISHRLYVAAVGNEAAPAKTVRHVTPLPRPVGIATAIPLELMAVSEPTPATAAPRLRAPVPRQGS
jgi:hypothetical protein